MRVVTSSSELVGLVHGAPGVVLVPTMGALHRGHQDLIRAAKSRALSTGEAVVATVFVNPAQFNERSDFDRYPRDLDVDARLAGDAGAEYVYAPSVSEVYPGGVPTGAIELPGVAVGKGLEDAGRPGHFEGVVRVLGRLFELTGCSSAVFGEKDWQQLLVARATAPLGVEIIGHPLVRDPDGLAMSSRNRHLTGEMRARALAIPRSVRAAQGATTVGEAEGLMRELLMAASVEIGYATVRDAMSLDVLPDGEARSSRGRVLVTGVVDGVRLLDNAAWVPEGRAG